MPYTVAITSQGQISIPAPLRKKMGLSKSGRALVTEKGGKLIIEPVKDLLELRGALKTNMRATPSQIRNKFEEYTAKKSP
jgi:AbrB family looped-hinge helix DNA binding protein